MYSPSAHFPNAAPRRAQTDRDATKFGKGHLGPGLLRGYHSTESLSSRGPGRPRNDQGYFALSPDNGAEYASFIEPHARHPGTDAFPIESPYGFPQTAFFHAVDGQHMPPPLAQPETGPLDERLPRRSSLNSSQRQLANRPLRQHSDTSVRSTTSRRHSAGTSPLGRSDTLLSTGTITEDTAGLLLYDPASASGAPSELGEPAKKSKKRPPRPPNAKRRAKKGSWLEAKKSEKEGRKLAARGQAIIDSLDDPDEFEAEPLQMADMGPMTATAGFGYSGTGSMAGNMLPSPRSASDLQRMQENHLMDSARGFGSDDIAYKGHFPSYFAPEMPENMPHVEPPIGNFRTSLYSASDRRRRQENNSMDSSFGRGSERNKVTDDVSCEEPSEDDGDRYIIDADSNTDMLLDADATDSVSSESSSWVPQPQPRYQFDPKEPAGNMRATVLRHAHQSAHDHKPPTPPSHDEASMPSSRRRAPRPLSWHPTYDTHPLYMHIPTNTGIPEPSLENHITTPLTHSPRSLPSPTPPTPNSAQQAQQQQPPLSTRAQPPLRQQQSSYHYNASGNSPMSPTFRQFYDSCYQPAMSAPPPRPRAPRVARTEPPKHAAAKRGSLRGAAVTAAATAAAAAQASSSSAAGSASASPSMAPAALAVPPSVPAQAGSGAGVVIRTTSPPTDGTPATAAAAAAAAAARAAANDPAATAYNPLARTDWTLREDDDEKLWLSAQRYFAVTRRTSTWPQKEGGVAAALALAQGQGQIPGQVQGQGQQGQGPGQQGQGNVQMQLQQLPAQMQAQMQAQIGALRAREKMQGDSRELQDRQRQQEYDALMMPPPPQPPPRS